MEKWITLATLAAIFTERMREVGTKRDVVRGKTQELLTFRLFMLGGMLMFAGGVWEFFHRGTPFIWWQYALGLGVALASFAIRRAAIRALGRFWSLHVEMRDGHEFVSSGPFAWMRHPTYFSMILELAGPAILCSAWWTFGTVMLIFIPTLILRLRLEEAALVEKFGDAYRQYQQSTPLIFPWKGKTR